MLRRDLTRTNPVPPIAPHMLYEPAICILGVLLL